MKWQGGRQSERVDDRRGGSKAALGGGGLVMVLGLAGVVWLLGGDPTAVLQIAAEQGGGASQASGSADNDELAKFVAVVLADTEDSWSKLLGPKYRPPTLVLFTDQVSSACGMQSSATGPFYCPADQKVYIDLGFYRDLRSRYGAPGDFAQAYVLAHEVGHHVQHLLGTSAEVRQAQGQRPDQKNALSVRLELQADCYAGVWAHHSGIQMEEGDLEEGLTAAAAIGDDTLQQKSGRGVRPESFTHGTSVQRMEWLQRGATTGDIRQCDTFSP